MKTIDEVMTKHKVEIPAHLEADAEIHLSTGPIRQGDVFVLPQPEGKIAGLKPIPPEGIAVVRGESGGNTHLLVAEGDVMYAPRDNGTADQGSLLVGDKGVAYLIHPEHGAQGLAPGSYIIRRQREQADEIRLVQD